MSSTSTQPQFRYTQPPSKVIHVRNLPWECTEEELTELGKPFGKIVNTKCNVGANQNQAFVEFAELNQAIAMVSYYASSADPAQVRGKTVYLQYSNRQEIMNSKSSGDVISNVLLVTIEGVEAGDVSIDVLHLVFSAFGFVHKIATFEKTAGFQALVQFSDSVTASTAKDALDGRSIPRYLLQEHIGPCSLKINFSAHTDLNVKFQSHRSRDYTNPYLPVAPSAIDGSGQLGIGQDGTKQEPESNVLLASIENMQYSVTIDVLHTVFSNFGFVQKIAIFEKNAGFQALVQFPDIPTAVVAKETLEGHPIYDGGFCKLHLTYSRHTDLNVKMNNDRGRDYTGANIAHLNKQPSILGQPAPQPSTAVQYPQSGNGVLPPPSSWNAGASSQEIMSTRPAASWDMGVTPRGVMPPQPAGSCDGAGLIAPPPQSSWNTGASSQGIMSTLPAASWDMGVTPRGVMPPRPAGSFDGAGLIAPPLHNQGYMIHSPMPPVMGPEMMSHPGQAWPQLPRPPSMPYGR